MKGAGLGLGLIILEGIILWRFSSNDTEVILSAGMALLVIYPADNSFKYALWNFFYG